MAYLNHFAQPLTGQRAHLDTAPTALRASESRGAVIARTPLGGQSERYLQSLQQPVPPAVDLTPGFPYGPYTPLVPLGTQQEFELGPRRWEYPIGANIQYTPRTTEAVSFDELRNFASIYDVARICIERRKHVLASFDWQVIARVKGEEKLHLDDIRTAEKFFEKPDKEHTWDKWLGMYMDDVLGIDAPAIHKRKDRKDNLYGLILIDGATLHPVIDDAGAVYGYQQVIYGVPRTVYINPYYLPFVEGAQNAENFPLDQLIYRPRVPTTYRLYGFPPGEQIILTINMMLRKQIQDLQHWVTGNIPEALAPMPEGTSLQAALQFQEDFNALLEGNPALRAQLRFLPGGIDPSKIKEFRPFSMETGWDELLMVKTCAAYFIAPQEIGLTARVNKATAQMQENVEYRSAVVPDTTDVESLCNDVLVDLGLPHLQFKIKFGEDEDILKQAQSDKVYFDMGATTIDRLISERALGDPLGIDEPFVIVPGVGLVWLNDAIKQRDTARQAPQGGASGNPGEPTDPAPHDGGPEGDGGAGGTVGERDRPVAGAEVSGADGGGAGERQRAGTGGAGAARSSAGTEGAESRAGQSAAATKVALGQWKENSLDRFRQGKRPKLDFVSEAIPLLVKSAIAARLAKAASAQDIKAAFASGDPESVRDKVPQQKGGELPVAPPEIEKTIRARLTELPLGRWKADPETVPVRKLWTFQTAVDPDLVAHFEDEKKKDLKDGDYFAVRYQGQFYLLDGNHHAAAAIQRGLELLEMRVLDLDRPIGPDEQQAALDEMGKAARAAQLAKAVAPSGRAEWEQKAQRHFKQVYRAQGERVTARLKDALKGRGLT